MNKDNPNGLVKNQCVVCGNDKGKRPSFCSVECASEYFFPSGWNDCKLIMFDNKVKSK